jgi:hypothetical protein
MSREKLTMQTIMIAAPTIAFTIELPVVLTLSNEYYTELFRLIPL